MLWYFGQKASCFFGLKNNKNSSGNTVTKVKCTEPIFFLHNRVNSIPQWRIREPSWINLQQRRALCRCAGTVLASSRPSPSCYSKGTLKKRLTLLLSVVQVLVPVDGRYGEALCDAAQQHVVARLHLHLPPVRRLCDRRGVCEQKQQRCDKVLAVEEPSRRQGKRQNQNILPEVSFLALR